MNKIFISGSRKISRLDAHCLERLENIVRRGLPIVIGDANGADKAVQRFLFERNYRAVEVFCSGPVCRNNIGIWPIREVSVRKGVSGHLFYAIKDRVMTEESVAGFMIWDGKSFGTLVNSFRLIRQGKPSVVYSKPSQSFSELRSRSDWETFISAFAPTMRADVEARISKEDAESVRTEQFAISF